MGGRGTKILVVDDHRERVRSLLECLGGDGLQAERAEDHEAALAAIGAGAYDVAIVGDRVQGTDGLEFVRALGATAHSVPVIVLTDRADRDAWQAALEAGAADCLVRDRIDREALERAIHLALRHRQTERALHAHEAWYHRLFEALPQPMLAYDVETLAVLEANHAAVAQYGYSREEFLNLKLTDIRPPDDVPRLMEWIRVSKDQPYVDAGCWRHRKKDGTVFEVEIRSNALTWNGRAARVILARDIAVQRQAEAARLESEQFVRGVLDSLLSSVSVVGADGTIQAVNRRWREATEAGGIPLIAGTVGSNYLNLLQAGADFDAAAAVALAQGLRAVLRGELPRFAREYAVPAAGTRHWFSVQVAPFHGDGPTRAVIKHVEITDGKRVEEALRESEQRFHDVLNRSKAMIYLKDLEGRYLFVNRCWTDVFGTTTADLAGKTDYELFPAATAAALRENDRRALSAGQTVEMDELLPHADGPHLYRSIKAPLYDVHRVAYATCGISTDVTARRAAEEALRESEARFRGAFDSAAIGMAIVASDGRFLQVNQSLCQFTGYSEAELLARDFQSITHPDDLEKDLTALASLFRGEIRTYRMEKRYLHKSGQTVWGLLCVSAVTDARGTPLYVIGEVEDITPRKRDEAAIARLFDRLTRLRQLDEAIVSAASPRAVAEAALDHLMQLIPCCCGRIDLIDARRGDRTVLATRGFAPEPHWRAPDAPLAVAATACCGNGIPATDLPCVLSRDASGQGRAYVRKPLTYKGRLLGGLHIYFDQPGPPDPEALEVVREVADLLAIALRQARLFRQVRRGQRRLSALSKRLIAAQEAERRRLARELHDEIGQSLTALKLSMQAGAESEEPVTRKALAEEGRHFIDQLIDQVRNLSLNLRPSMLDDFGLVSALRWYVDRLARHSGIVCRLAVDPPDIRAPAEIETACFRIAQEALTNVARHAAARHLWVELRGTEHELAMAVRDDGAGFEPCAARERAAQGAGLGLLGMRERAALLGGRIEIATRPGEGTAVHVTIPLARREP